MDWVPKDGRIKARWMDGWTHGLRDGWVDALAPIFNSLCNFPTSRRLQRRNIGVVVSTSEIERCDWWLHLPLFFHALSPTFPPFRFLLLLPRPSFSYSSLSSFPSLSLPCLSFLWFSSTSFSFSFLSFLSSSSSSLVPVCVCLSVSCPLHSSILRLHRTMNWTGKTNEYGCLGECKWNVGWSAKELASYRVHDNRWVALNSPTK